MEGLNDFIVMAKRATYPAAAAKSLPYRLATSDLQLHHDPWSYHDSYAGETDFLGQELVYRDWRRCIRAPLFRRPHQALKVGTRYGRGGQQHRSGHSRSPPAIADPMQRVLGMHSSLRALLGDVRRCDYCRTWSFRPARRRTPWEVP